MSINPKMTEVVKILKKIFVSSERLEEFQWHFQEKCNLDNVKNCKKVGAHPLSRKHIF